MPKVERLLRTAAAEPRRPNPCATRRTPAESHRDLDDIGDDEIRDALSAHGWILNAAAAALGVARSSLHKRMKNSLSFRVAAELSREEIGQAQEACGGQLEAMAGYLEVSIRGLKLRMKALGLR
ncbi:MAG: hypothetical protein GY856_26275 [bacterium]|nr:hypothetical protein [bacterium]